MSVFYRGVTIIVAVSPCPLSLSPRSHRPASSPKTRGCLLHQVSSQVNKFWISGLRIGMILPILRCDFQKFLICELTLENSAVLSNTSFLGTFHHVALVYNGETGMGSLWLDGSLLLNNQVMGTVLGYTDTYNGMYWKIGGLYDSSTGQFDVVGQLSSVYLFNYPIDQGVVNELYSQSPCAESGITSYNQTIFGGGRGRGDGK
jgi:hypothetical protein